jgi:hypothetical protein
MFMLNQKNKAHDGTKILHLFSSEKKNNIMQVPE